LRTHQGSTGIPNKKELIEMLRKVLKTDQDLRFLLKISQEDLKLLVECRVMNGRIN
jgi:hypothetical protein